MDLHFRNLHPGLARANATSAAVPQPALAVAIALNTLIPQKVLSSPRARVLCRKCGELVYEDSTFIHSLDCRKKRDQAKSLNLPTRRLSFILLPRGELDIRDAIEHYRKASHTFPSGLSGRRIDNSRLENIATLSPLSCYIGNASWSGYVVFEFKDSNSVVLECPFEGNATYILHGDWKSMVVHSKAGIMRLFEKRYTRVVHKGDWLSRIREALRGSWNGQLGYTPRL